MDEQRAVDRGGVVGRTDRNRRINVSISHRLSHGRYSLTSSVVPPASQSDGRREHNGAGGTMGGEKNES